jgi:hypothetical protein
MAAVLLFRQRSYEGFVRSNRGELGIWAAITLVRAVMRAKIVARMVTGGLDGLWLGARAEGKVRRYT